MQNRPRRSPAKGREWRGKSQRRRPTWRNLYGCPWQPGGHLTLFSPSARKKAFSGVCCKPDFSCAWTRRGCEKHQKACHAESAAVITGFRVLRPLFVGGNNLLMLSQTIYIDPQACQVSNSPTKRTRHLLFPEFYIVRVL